MAETIDVNGQSIRLFDQRSATSIGTELSLLQQIAPFLQPVYRKYLLEGVNQGVSVPPDSKFSANEVYNISGYKTLTAEEMRLLDALREDPTKVNLNDYRGLARAGAWTTGDTDNPGVGEQLSETVMNYGITQQRFEQSESNKPDITVGRSEALKWNAQSNAWTVVSTATFRPTIIRTLTDEEVRRNTLLDPETGEQQEVVDREAGVAGAVTTPGMEAQRPALPTTPTTPAEAAAPAEGAAQPPTTDMTGLGVAFGTTGIAAGEAAAGEPAPAPSGVEDGVVVPGAPSEIAEVPADSNIPEDWRDAAREMYPEYYAIVRNIPEIAELLELAVAGEYTPQQFQAELEQTNWWQQTTASAREWDINGERDPASQQTLIDNQITNIRSIALNQFGVRLSNENLQALAVDSLRLGWSSAFLQNAIGDVATQSTAGISQLRAGYIGQQLRETANDYGIAVSDATFNQWVNKVAVGQETVATWQDYAKVQAKNLFPSIADRIDAGETFQQIVDPYRQTAAKVLELGTGEDIDFTAPEWAKAVTFMDSEGNQRPMSYTEWNDYLRQTRSFGYEYTTEARSRAYSVAQDLANIFGRA
jgi:hypothetical protein